MEILGKSFLIRRQWNRDVNEMRERMIQISKEDESRQKKQSNKCRGSEVEACWLYSQNHRDTTEARAM